MTEATPLSLRRDGIMSGAIWPFPVDEWSLQSRNILQTASEFILFSLFFSSPFLILISASMFLQLLTSRSGSFTCILKLRFHSGAVTVLFLLLGYWLCSAPVIYTLDLLPIIATTINAAAEFLSHIASIFIFSSLLPEGLSLFVHRQILAMSEQLLGLNRWLSFTGRSIWKGYSVR